MRVTFAPRVGKQVAQAVWATWSNRRPFETGAAVGGSWSKGEPQRSGILFVKKVASLEQVRLCIEKVAREDNSSVKSGRARLSTTNAVRTACWHGPRSVRGLLRSELSREQSGRAERRCASRQVARRADDRLVTRRWA